MGFRALVIGVVVSGALASSCASAARDTLVDIYNDDASASAGAGSFDEACRIDDKTFTTATEAYLAVNATMPTSTADLVPEWIREAPEAWDFDPDSASSFRPTLGGRCEGFTVTRLPSPSIGQAAVDVIDDGNNAGCVTDKRQVETAQQIHFVVNGYDAMTMDELLEFGVEDEMNRWTLQVSTDAANPVPVVVPVVGGPCDG